MCRNKGRKCWTEKAKSSSTHRVQLGIEWETNWIEKLRTRYNILSSKRLARFPCMLTFLYRVSVCASLCVNVYSVCCSSTFSKLKNRLDEWAQCRLAFAQTGQNVEHLIGFASWRERERKNGHYKTLHHGLYLNL